MGVFIRWFFLCWIRGSTTHIFFNSWLNYAHKVIMSFIERSTQKPPLNRELRWETFKFDLDICYSLIGCVPCSTSSFAFFPQPCDWGESDWLCLWCFQKLERSTINTKSTQTLHLLPGVFFGSLGRLGIKNLPLNYIPIFCQSCIFIWMFPKIVVPPNHPF